MDEQQPASGDQPKRTERSSLLVTLILPILLIVGWYLGTEVGETLGADYENVGKATGERIGKWLGWGVGVGTAFVIAAVLLRPKAYAAEGSAMRRTASVAVVWLAFVLSGAMGAVGEIYVGELGGPGFFLLFWFLLSVIVMAFARRRREAVPD